MTIVVLIINDHGLLPETIISMLALFFSQFLEMTDYPSNLIHFTGLTDNILHLVQKNNSDKEQMWELMIVYLCSEQKQFVFSSCKWKISGYLKIAGVKWDLQLTSS